MGRHELLLIAVASREVKSRKYQTLCIKLHVVARRRNSGGYTSLYELGLIWYFSNHQADRTKGTGETEDRCS